MIAADPIALPACDSESKSSVTFSASDAVRIGRRRPAGNHGLERPPVGDPASDLVDEVVERVAVGQLVVARPHDVAGEREDPRAGRALDTELCVLRAAHLDDRRHRRDRLDVVDRGRRGIEACDRGERRLRPRLAAVALEGLEQRGLLAADVGAGAPVEDDRHAAEELRLAQLVERRDEDLPLVLVLAADVDEHVLRLDSARGDQAALEEAERDAEHDLAVLERAGLGLVRVDDEVVGPRVLVGLRNEAPFAARREERAAAAAQARRVELGDDLLRRHLPRAAEGGQPADRLVRREVGDRAAVGAGEDDLGRRAHSPSSFTMRGTSAVRTCR